MALTKQFQIGGIAGSVQYGKAGPSVVATPGLAGTGAFSFKDTTGALINLQVADPRGGQNQDIVTLGYLNSVVGDTGIHYKGTVDASQTAEAQGITSPVTGDLYRVTVTGDSFPIASSTHADVGDFFIFNATSTWDLIVGVSPTVNGTTNQIAVVETDPETFTISIDPGYAGQASIVTLGTVTSGTWNGSTVDLGHGGTGLTSVGTANQVLTTDGSSLSYAYTSVVRDTSGNAVSDGSTGTLIATDATVDGDDTLAYTTKGYVQSLVAGGDLTGGNGIDITDNVVSALLASGSVLAFDGDSIGITGGTTGQALLSNASGEAAFGALDISTSAVTGVLSISNGGTNLSTSGAQNQVLTVTNGGGTLGYAYVGAVFDDAGNVVSSVTSQAVGGANKLEAAVATVATDDELSFTTLGYVTAAIAASEVNLTAGNGINITGNTVSVVNDGAGVITVDGDGVGIKGGLAGLPLLAGGDATEAVFGALDISTAAVTGFLPVGNGGTGTSGLDGVILGNGGNAMSAVTVGGTGTVLLGDDSGTPSFGTVALEFLSDVTIADVANGQTILWNSTDNKWENGEIDLSANVTGTLPVANGGTGATTVTGLVLGTGTTAMVGVTVGATGTVLLGDTSGTPDFGTIDLEFLSDVQITSVANGDALVWNSTDSKWENLAINITQTLEDLTDVQVTSIAPGNALVWNNQASKWENGPVDLTNTNAVSGSLPVPNGGTGKTTLTANGVLLGNGASSINATAVGTTGEVLLATTGAAPSFGTVSMEFLSDVLVTSIANGQVLTWNSTASKWENTAINGNAFATVSDGTHTAAATGAQTLNFADATNGGLSVVVSGSNSTSTVTLGLLLSNLATGAAVSGTDVIAVSQSGVTKSTTASALATYINSVSGIPAKIQSADTLTSVDTGATTATDVTVKASDGTASHVVSTFATGASADSVFAVSNATAGEVTLSATSGTDANVNLRLVPQGTGEVIIGSTGDGLIQSDNTFNLKLSGGDSTTGSSAAGNLILKGGNATGSTGAAGVTIIEDSLGNNVAEFLGATTPVNFLTFTNSATGAGPTIAATGSDTNVNLVLSPKGTGLIIAPTGYTAQLTSTGTTEDVATKGYIDTAITAVNTAITTAKTGVVYTEVVNVTTTTTNIATAFTGRVISATVVVNTPYSAGTITLGDSVSATSIADSSLIDESSAGVYVINANNNYTTSSTLIATLTGAVGGSATIIVSYIHV